LNMDETSSSFPASSAPQMRFGKIDDLGSRVAAAVDGARKFLFSQQHEDGYWCGELEADTTLESDYILLHTLLGTGNAERFQKCCNWILQHQNPDGGWGIYVDAPSNISASVKGYFALKLSGYSPEHPALVRARKKILEMGGVTEVNTFTKIYLCFLGQFDYDAVPAIPPFSWRAPIKRSTISAGSLVTLSSTTSSAPHGPGTRSATPEQPDHRIKTNCLTASWLDPGDGQAVRFLATRGLENLPA